MTSAFQKLCGVGNSRSSTTSVQLRIAKSAATTIAKSASLRAPASSIRLFPNITPLSLLPSICSNLHTETRWYSATSLVSSSEQNQRPTGGRRGSPTITEQYHDLTARTEHLFRQQNIPALKSQQLLGNWLYVMSRLKNKQHLRNATNYADRLAYKVLDLRPSTSDVLDDDDNASRKDGSGTNSSTQRASSGSSSDPESSRFSGFVKEVIRFWAKLEEAGKAESLLRYQIEAYEQTGKDRPHNLAFASVISAFSRDKSEHNVRAALYWFNQMDDPKPLEAYNSVLNTFANQGLAVEASEFFHDMKDKSEVEIDNITFSTVMKAWVRSKRHDAQENVEKVLQELKETYEAKGRPQRLIPNFAAYGSAMSLASPERANALLREMQDAYERTRNSLVRPTARHYVNVMKSWADVGKPHEAEKLLLEMEQEYKAGNEKLRPNIHCFVVIIAAYAKQGTVDGIEKAEQILNQMEKQVLDGRFAFEINNYAYNIVMDAIGRTNKDATKVEAIFERMKILAEERNLLDLQPDVVSYTALMKAWIAEEKPGFATKVENLLEEMEDSKSVKPDIRLYGVVLNALSRCGDVDAGSRGEVIVRRMIERGVEPNRVCYNCIINIYAARGNAKKAKEVLEWMEHEAANGNFRAKTSARDYSACISAFAVERQTDTEHFEEAHQLFLTVVGRYKAGDRDFKSSSSILTSLMVVLGRTAVEGKAKVAKEIWDLAEEIDTDLDRRSYNALFKACSEERGSPQEQLEALELAVTSFQLMRQRGTGVDSQTFIYLMCCCHNLIQEETERMSATEEFFQNCCDAGVVTDDALSHFHNFVPTSTLLSNLLEDGAVAVDRIPYEWKQAVRQVYAAKL